MERSKYTKYTKLITVATVAAGLLAAYLMRRRGEPVLKIARKTLLNPVGSMAEEVKNVVTSKRLSDVV
jgi:hypothetical protein